MLVDPLDLTPVQNLISKESKEKYFRYWKYYVKDQEISSLKKSEKIKEINKKIQKKFIKKPNKN